MGTGARVREAYPDVDRRRRRAAAGRPGDGPALAGGRLRAADPRRLEARPEAARLERRVGRRRPRAARLAKGSSRASRRRGRPRRAADRRGAARGLGRRLRARRRRLEVPLGATSGAPRTSRSRWRARSGGSPGRRSAPSSTRTPPRRRRTSAAACSSSATGSPSGTFAAATASPRPTATSSRSTRRCGSWRTTGFELAVFHSHPETEPRPSRTDRALSGLWAGKPFLIYGLKLQELRAWRITPDEVEELPLS